MAVIQDIIAALWQHDFAALADRSLSVITVKTFWLQKAVFPSQPSLRYPVLLNALLINAML